MVLSAVLRNIADGRDRQEKKMSIIQMENFIERRGGVIFNLNADTEGEWYASMGYTYTYYDNGKIHSKLMSSGGYSDGAQDPMWIN